MTTLDDVKLQFGQVEYHRGMDPTPPTSETSTGEGNVTVTVNNAARPGVPERYEVSFMLSCRFAEDDFQFSNVFHWTTYVLGRGTDVRYSAIEAEAARKIAPMLRDVAQRIEASVAEYDSRQPNSSA